MNTVQFALYDAFSKTPFGGSQAAIILNAGGIGAQSRMQIAREFGWPATCFVINVSENCGKYVVCARFCSTMREYPMCGHGTICLMAMLSQSGAIEWQDGDKIEVELQIPIFGEQLESNASVDTFVVEIYKPEDRHAGARIMLDMVLPTYENQNLDMSPLAKLFGLNVKDIDQAFALEIAAGSFSHLIVPIKGLDAMKAMKPDFETMRQFCLDVGIDTIATYCQEVENSKYDIHVRDFCPAVGVYESAAAGTTNAALAGYLDKHGLVEQISDGTINITAEQGLEIGRPAVLHTIVSKKNNIITRLQTGGIATKILEGNLMVTTDLSN